MRKKLASIVVLVALLTIGGGAAASGASARAAAPAPEPAYGAKLAKEVRQVMKANAIPGAVVMVESPQKGNWSGTFGTAAFGKKVPMSLADYLRVGSNTKTMTGTVILQLVEEGKLALEDPISKFVPSVPNGQNITIAELLEMRSGLFSYTSDKGLNESMDTHPNKGWRPSELLKIAFSHPSPAAPGTVFEYNNTNYVLLGVVLQKLTGMSASKAFKERIFKPLGMTQTTLPGRTDSRLPQPHALGYQFRTNVQTLDTYKVPKSQQKAALDGTLRPFEHTLENPSWAWTAGSAISTPRDLATYVKALVGGGLLDKKTQKIRLDSIKPVDDSVTNGVGYGLGIAQFAPGILGHDGQVPGYSTFMSYDLKTGDTIIVGTNLSASPITGENAAVEVAKGIFGVLR
jgi:D-alanyl-D-alanine carboxypeptidase